MKNYVIGEVAVIELIFTDDITGDPVDPNPLTVSVLTEALNTVADYTYGPSPNFFKDGPGEYHLDIDTTPSGGIYTWYQGAAIAGQTASTGQFYVKPDPAVPTVTQPPIDLSSPSGSSAIGFIQTATGAVARTVQAKLRDEPLSLRDFGALCDGVTDDTAAFQAAMSALTLGHKRLYIPGQVRITSTIEFLQMEGCEIFGDGPGQTSIRAGSGIIWDGAATDTAIRVKSCGWMRLHDFFIDGNNKANIGLSVTAANVLGSCQLNLFENISVKNCSAGFGIYCGSATNDDVSQNTFRNVFVQNNLTGIYQDGTQSVQNYFNRISVFGSLLYGMYFNSGDIHVDKALFIDDSASLASVYVTPNCRWATFSDCDFEITGGGPTRRAFWFAIGARLGFATKIDGGRVKWDNTSGNPIYWDQGGALLLTGWTLQSDSGTGTSTLVFQNSGAGTAVFTAFGNQIGSGQTMTLGSTGIIANLDPLMAGMMAAQIGGVTPLPFLHYAPDSSGSKIMLMDLAPQLLFREVGAAANNTTWGFLIDGEQLILRVLNDARNASANIFTVDRTANTVDRLTLSTAPLNLPHGAAPSSPVNGDIWTTTAGLFVRVNGNTIGPLS